MALVQRRSSTAAATTERTASRRTAAPADDEGDDEPRTPRRAASRRTEPEFTEPARDADDGYAEEPEDRPARGRSGGSNDAVQSGWGAAKKLKQEGGEYADEFKFDKEPVLVAFVGDSPFAVYRQHWVEGLRSTGKKSFICLGKGCPLCAVGESAAKKWAFNVAVIGDDDAEMKALIAGSRLFDLIADSHEQKNGIDNGYWALSKSGKKQSTTYKLEYVKERDLEEDWKVTPEEVDDMLKGLEPYSAEQFKAPSKTYLQEIADELTGEGD